MPPYGFADGTPTFGSFAELVASGGTPTPGTVYYYMDGGVRKEGEYTEDGRWVPVDVPPNDLWNFIGDSITASGGGWDGVTGLEKNGGRYAPGSSPQSFMAFLSQGRIRFCRNFGFGGKGCAELLLRFDMIAESPAKNHIIQIGTNDFGSGNTALVDFETFLKKLIPISVKIAVIAIPPNSTAVPASWNLAQEAICRKYGVPFISPYAKLTNPTTGKVISGSTPDGTHPYPFATLAVADDALKQFPDAFLSPKPGRYVGQANLLPNGFFATDTNADGVADSWVVGGIAGVISTPSDTSIQGRVQKFTPLAGRTDSYARVPIAGLTIGREYVLTATARIVNDYRNLLTICVMSGQGVGNVMSYMSMSGGASTANNVDKSGVICMRFVAETTTASFNIFWHDSAAAGLETSPIELSEVTVLEAA